MSQPNTCEICDAQFTPGTPHECKRETLLELLDEANDRIAIYEIDSARLDWLDDDIDRLEDVRGYLNNAEDEEDVRDAIDFLMSDEDDEDEEGE